MDPANMPIDTDADGIFDLCDNCIESPNGPNLGTCVGGFLEGNSCYANSDCSNGLCSLSQEDADADSTGDACSLVPEPEFATMLAIGAMLLMCASRRRVTAAHFPLNRRTV
jgi:hypothetical protein